MSSGRYCSYRRLWPHHSPSDAFCRSESERVKSYDLRIVNKFNTSYKRFVLPNKLNKLSHRIFWLEQEVTYPIQPRHQWEAEDIVRLQTEGIQFARSANWWTQLLIHEIWQLFFALWLHRNEAYHSNPITQNQIQQLSKINREIRRQWAIGLHGIPHADKHHFTHTKLAQLLKKTLHYKQTWLQAATKSTHQTDESSWS